MRTFRLIGMPLAKERVNEIRAVEPRTQKETKMRALDHPHAGHHGSTAQISLFKSISNRFAQFSETIWLCITFLLFIVMGPFSVIAVVYGLWALATGENKERMVEPAGC